MRGGEESRPVRRVWVPQVAVDVDALWVRTNVAEVRQLTAAEKLLLCGVRRHLEKARKAAFRIDPLPRRLGGW